MRFGRYSERMARSLAPLCHRFAVADFPFRNRLAASRGHEHERPSFARSRATRNARSRLASNSVWRGLACAPHFLGRCQHSCFVLLAQQEHRTWQAWSSLQLLIAALLQASLAWAGQGRETATWHLAADVVHLLVAGLWPAGLWPLFWFLRKLVPISSPDANLLAGALVRRFSAMSLVAVLALVLTGWINSYFLVGSLGNLFTQTSRGLGARQNRSCLRRCGRRRHHPLSPETAPFFRLIRARNKSNCSSPETERLPRTPPRHRHRHYRRCPWASSAIGLNFFPPSPSLVWLKARFARCTVERGFRRVAPIRSLLLIRAVCDYFSTHKNTTNQSGTPRPWKSMCLAFGYD